MSHGPGYARPLTPFATGRGTAAPFIVVFLLTCLALFVPAHGADENKAFLWKATSATATVYLLGSLHVADESFYPLPARVETAFETSDFLAVEVDVGSIGDLSGGKTLLTHGFYHGDENLRKNIPQDLWGRLERELGGGGTMEQVNRMRPWLAALTVTQRRLASLGYRADLGIDLHFLRKARRKKEILSLETAEFQLRLFSGMPEDLQVLFLEDALQEMDRVREEKMKFEACWKTGDPEELEKLVYGPLQRKPAFAPVIERLFGDRNVSMTNKIAGYLMGKRTGFVVVGAGHLVGDRGIVNLLRRRGFQVEQI